MDFVDIFSKAWKIIWKHKVLWVFSFMALCGALVRGIAGGFFGVVSFLIAIYLDGLDTAPELASPLWMQKIFFQIQHIVEDGILSMYAAPVVVIVILLALLLAAVLLLARTVGNICLVRGVWQADAGQTALTFSSLLAEVRHYLWSTLLFLLALTVFGVVAGLVLFLPLAAVFILTLGCGMQCLMPVSIAVSGFVRAFVDLTMIAILGEDLKIPEAMQRAWGTLTRNLGAIALMTLLLFAGQFVLSNFTAQPLMLMLIPGMTGIAAGTKSAVTAGLFASGIFLIIYILLSIMLYIVLHAFVSTAWTLVFRRLTGRGADETPAQCRA